MNHPRSQFLQRAIVPLIRIGTFAVCLGIVALTCTQPTQPGNIAPEGQPIPHVECANLTRTMESAGREALDACEVALVRTTVSLVRACEAVKSLLPNPPQDHARGGKDGPTGARSHLLHSIPLS
jgi:hypothetical protein